MKTYVSLFRIRFLTSLQYRAAALAGIATQFAWGGFEVLLFKALYESNPAALPMEISQLADYIWLRQAFLALYASWYWDKETGESVSSGSVAYEFTRPLDVYAMWFCKDMGNRAARAMLRAWPILLFALFLPAPYGISAPAGLLAGLCFPLSILMGFVIAVAFSLLLYISAFYTVSPMGLRTFSIMFLDFCAGDLLPLPFFPSGMQRILELLPFASIGNAPFRIYSGNIAGRELWETLALQAFWALALVALGRLWMRAASRRLVVQGG